MAFGLPVIRDNQEFVMVMDRLQRDVPTCRPDELLGEAGRRAQQKGLSVCPVVNDQQIVLGLVAQNQWEKDPTASAEQVMEPGPATVRPSHPLEQAEEMLRKSGQSAVLVTNSDGKLLGAFLGAKEKESGRKEQLPDTEVWS